MIDGNKLIFNQATMKKAVQYWLNEEVLQNNEKVNCVSYNTNLSNFEIILETSVPVKP